MIKCQTCGAENQDNSQYCDECGATLMNVEDENKIIKRKCRTRRFFIRAMLRRLEFRIFSTRLRKPKICGSKRAEAKGVHAVLTIERGESTGMEFPLASDESLVGRWDADNGIFPDIDLDRHDPEAKVSRRHARILHNDGQYSIEDLGSTNGTFVNRGRRLLPGDRQSLRDGDEIIVGKTFLRFHVTK